MNIQNIYFSCNIYNYTITQLLMMSSYNGWTNITNPIYHVARIFCLGPDCTLKLACTIYEHMYPFLTSDHTDQDKILSPLTK